MTDALRFDGVRKTYGRHVALDGLTCRFPQGSICAFVGPNGAGKTTAFSVVSGFLGVDEGSVHLLGEDGFDPWRLKGRLGVLPQDAELSDRHTPRELLVHLGRLQGLGYRPARDEAERVLDVVRLTDRRDRRIATLSHGMRRRVAVASALVGSPELVLLDEPTAGLDPSQARSLREALDALRGVQTLIVSSHNLAELERLCDWVVMLDHGRCVAQGTIDEVTGAGNVVRWQLASAASVVLEAISARLEQTFEADGDWLVQRAASEEDLDSGSLVVMEELARAGVALRGVQRGVGLERRFYETTDPAS